MSDSSIVSIFFRLTNFAVLAAVGYYAYRKYLKSSLEEKVTQKEAVLKGLAEQGCFLEGRAEDLDEQARMQERHINLLKQKIDEWQNAVLAQHHKHQEENRIFRERALRRTQEKNEQVARHELRLNVAPVIMAQAERSLRAQFSDAQAHKQYIQDVLHTLRKHS